MLAPTRAQEACRVIGVIARVDGDVEDLFDRVASRLATLDLHEVEQFLLAIEHQVVVAEEDRPAILERSLGPRRLCDPGACGSHRYIIGGAGRCRAEGFPGERRTHDRSFPSAAGLRHKFIQPGNQRCDPAAQAGHVAGSRRSLSGRMQHLCLSCHISSRSQDHIRRGCVGARHSSHSSPCLPITVSPRHAPGFNISSVTFATVGGCSSMLA